VQKLTRITAILSAITFAPWAMADEPVRPDQVVGAMEQQAGVTPGHRRNHINGVCIAGNFVGDKAAQKYTQSAVFSGKELAVVGRFSLAGGSTKVPDTARNPRGMALELRLPKGEMQHFTLLNVPMFGAATPQSFYENVIAGTPDPQTGKPDPEKIAAYRASHPDAQALGQFLAANNPIASYGSSDYYGIHAFTMTDRKGRKTLVKWRFVPRDGVKRLSDDELKAAPTRFLNDALFKRVAQSPLQWDMVLVIGQPGDEQTNPTISWPADRTEVHAGVLTLKTASEEAGSECEKINFDPLVMSKGIAPTQDPILLFRSGAYAVSFGKRLTGQ
jgi:catalase